MRFDIVESNTSILPLQRARQAFIRSCSRLVASAGIGACLVLAACASDPGSEAGDDSLAADAKGGVSSEPNVIAQALLEDGRTVKFLEPTPGVLIEYETGRSDAVHADEPADLSFVERFEFLTGEPAPEALVLAQERSQSAEGQVDGSDELLFDGTQNKSRVAPAYPIDSLSFRNQYCVATDRNYFFKDINGSLNWGATGVNYLKSGVRCNAGLIYVSMGYSTQWTNNNESVQEWVPGGYFVAIRSSSSAQAKVGIAVVDGDAQAESYDACWNWHF